jgi:hypothetical protein
MQLYTAQFAEAEVVSAGQGGAGGWALSVGRRRQRVGDTLELC